jgi:hypothetical protein
LRARQARHRRTGGDHGQPGLGIVFDADRVHAEAVAVHEGVGLVGRGEGVDLELRLVAVRIGVIHRHRDAVMDAPVWDDAAAFSWR